MNENTPMSQAQQLFAEEHHNLVYAFLKEKKLPEDEYYDVVIFGYLQAVMDYTSQGEVQLRHHCMAQDGEPPGRPFPPSGVYQACGAYCQPERCHGRSRPLPFRYALRNG